MQTIIENFYLVVLVCIFLFIVRCLQPPKETKSTIDEVIKDAMPLPVMPLPVVQNKWARFDDYTIFIEMEHGWLVEKKNECGSGLAFVPKPAQTTQKGN